MNICQNCKTENDADSKFCKNCGSEIKVINQSDDTQGNVDLENIDGDVDNEKPRKKFFLFRSKRNVIVTIVCIVLVATIYILWSSGIVFNGIADSLYNTYLNEEKSYEDVIDKIEFIDKLGNVEWVKDKCNALKNSRDAYNKAKSHQDNNEYKEAMEEYQNVIIEDSNYNEAQEQIKICEESFYYLGTKIPSYTGVIGIKPYDVKKVDIGSPIMITTYFYRYTDNKDIVRILEDLSLYAEELKADGWNLIESENEVGNGYSIHTFKKGNDSIIMENRYSLGEIRVLII